MAAETFRQKAARFAASILAAHQFLLVTPAFIKRPFSDQELGNSVAYYPLAGLVLGLALTAANWLLRLFAPDLIRAAVLLSAWVVATGALHLDGFLDSCDGLLGGSTPEKRMEIMRDERIGAFGFTGGLLLILLKFSALATLHNLGIALILAPVLGRWAMSMAIVTFPYSRPEGLGRSIKNNAGRKQVAIASIIALAIVIWSGMNRSALIAVVSIAAAAFTAFLTARFSLVRIKGLTGDIYGAICEAAETSVLVALSCF